LQGYQEQFIKLVDAERIKGLTPKTGLRGSMRKAAHLLGSRFTEKLSEIAQVIHKEERIMYIVAGGSLLISGMFILILVSWISHTISKAMKELIEATLSLISDEKVKADVSSEKNELNILRRSVDYLHEKLQRAFNQFQTAASHIEDVSKDMLEVTKDVQKSTEEEHQKIEQSATAIHEMNASIHEVAESANRSAEFVKNVNERLTKTTELSGVAQDAITSLQDELQHAVGAISELETASQGTESVLDSIQDIAAQTNLLALNAAIEAARAGEQGRGFAVVADEVRSLSLRTAESTDEVRATMKRFQGVIADVVGAIQSSSEKGDEGKDQSHTALRLMREMSQSMAEVSMMNLQIASSVEEQSNAASEIDRHIVSIQDSSEHVREKADQTMEESNKLRSVANVILETVNSIHV